jgi:hypothetical protein
VQPPKEAVEDLGKKAQALRDAKTADQGSAWGDLVKH